jgi:membrane associated rhomboid family serine protease
MSTFQSRSIFKNAYRSDIVRLIITCGGLFVLLGFTRMIFSLTDVGTAFFTNYLEQPLYLPTAIQDFIYQPWSLFTFGFIDQGFWMLLSNMIWLWVFGSIIEDLTGTNRVFPLFWVGTIFGGLVYLLLNIFLDLPNFNYAGTIGGVAAVAAGAVTYNPKYPFYYLFGKPVPLFVFGIIFFVLTIIFRLGNWSALIFFISGAAIGVMFNNVLYSFFQKLGQKLASLRTYFSSNDNFIKTQSGRSFGGYLERNNLELNAILDKINTKGMNSLNEQEKNYLKKYGE